MFPVSPSLIHHERNTSNMIGNSVNRSKLPSDDLGVGQSSKNESMVAQRLSFSNQNDATG